MRWLRRIGCWLRGHHRYTVGDILKVKRGEMIHCKDCKQPREVKT